MSAINQFQSRESESSSSRESVQFHQISRRNEAVERQLVQGGGAGKPQCIL